MLRPVSIFFIFPFLHLSFIFSSSSSSSSSSFRHPLRLLFVLESSSNVSTSLDVGLTRWRYNNPKTQVMTSRVFLPDSGTGNAIDTVRMICESIEVLHPHLIVSFVPRDKIMMPSLAASSATLPLINLGHYYQDSPIYDMQVQVGTDIRSMSWRILDLLDRLIGAEVEDRKSTIICDDSFSSQLLTFHLNKESRRRRKKFSNDTTTSPGSRERNRFQVIKLWTRMERQEIFLKVSQIRSQEPSSSSSHVVIVFVSDKEVLLNVVDGLNQLNLFNVDSRRLWLFIQLGPEEELMLPSSSGILSLRQRLLPTPSLHYATIKTSFDALQLAWKDLDALYAISGSSSSIRHQFETSSCWTSSKDVRIMSKTIITHVKELLQPERRQPLPDSDLHKSRRNQSTIRPVDVDAVSDLTNVDFDIFQLTDQRDDNVNSSSSRTWMVIGNLSSDGHVVLDDRTFKYSTSGSRRDQSSRSSGQDQNYQPRRPSRYRIVSAIAPPFVQESTMIWNATCLTGVPCLKVNSSIPGQIVGIFVDFESGQRRLQGTDYSVACCSGIAIDLLNSMARDLNFDYDLYLVADGLFGVPRNGHWDGITADLVTGAAHMAFTAFSVTSSRIEVIDYSVPFFYSGVSCLSFNRIHEDSVPLVAFLVPFSALLWTAIFTALFVTAVAVAIYEWISPFGLNPWGRQRTKNFTLASAAWVMTSLLFSHLVAFKAPKSWPNKVLINVWAGFSVIFLATYTANIAAHFAGLFAEVHVKDFHDGILMSLKTGVARSSASEGHILRENIHLYDHVQKYRVSTMEEGLEKLRAKKLDVLIGDTAILDYFRANDPGCNLNLLGDSIFDDAYAIGMMKGFPLKERISNLILEYNAYGYLDQLQRKWYERVPCLEDSWGNLSRPSPLGIRAVAGVFIMLGCGLIAGIIILFLEHLFYKYLLPRVRKSGKDSFWKSPNLMFFSQKLYRFVNSVELVSPHHSAKEIMTNLKEGQITSLFQKSLKRKANEDARRRKSKSQFFEMIQEVRKVVQEQRTERSKGLQLPPLESSSRTLTSISTIDSAFSTSPSTSTSSSSSSSSVEMRKMMTTKQQKLLKTATTTSATSRLEVVSELDELEEEDERKDAEQRILPATRDEDPRQSPFILSQNSIQNPSITALEARRRAWVTTRETITQSSKGWRKIVRGSSTESTLTTSASVHDQPSSVAERSLSRSRSRSLESVIRVADFDEEYPFVARTSRSLQDVTVEVDADDGDIDYSLAASRHVQVESLTKDEVVLRWMESERRLLEALKSVLREKDALQRLLRKSSNL